MKPEIYIMKNSIVVLSLLFISSLLNAVCAQNSEVSNVYWEQLNDSVKKEIILSSEVNDDVRNFYNRKFRITDSDKSFRLLDTLTTEQKNTKIKALYFYLFNRICTQTDGAVGEVLAKYCLKIFMNDPVFLLDYFSSHNSVMKAYAQRLGYEFYFKKDGTSDIKYDFSELKKITNAEIDNSTNLKKTFRDFCKEIEITISNMD
jgi:hypothetical protein